MELLTVFSGKSAHRRRMCLYMGSLFLILLWKPLSSQTKAPANQQIEFEHLSVREGLSQSSVHCLTQDSHGYMWFGTLNGLNRYDGYQFTVFRHTPADSTSLGHNRIQTLFEDAQQRLWVGTVEGISLFDRRREIFINHRHNPEDSASISNEFILAIFQDNSGIIWIGTLGGLNKLTSDAQDIMAGQFQFQHFRADSAKPGAISGDIITAIAEDNANRLWFGTNRGLNRFDREQERFIQMGADAETPDIIKSSLIWDIFEDQRKNSNQLWLGTRNGLAAYAPESGQFKIYQHHPGNLNSLSHNTVRNIAQTPDGLLWLATALGMNRFDPAAQTFTHLQYDAENPASLRANYVWEICVDRSGIIWAGTSPGGINKLVRRQKKFKLIEEKPATRNTLNDNFIFSVREDHQKNLWIGTWSGGLNKMIRRSENDGPRFSQYYRRANDPNSLPGNSIFAIYEDRSGAVWLGTARGLAKTTDLNPASGFERISHNLNAGSAAGTNVIYAIREDAFGGMWIGTHGGLFHQPAENRPAGEFIAYQHQPDDPGSLSENLVQAIYETRDSTLWIATDIGLNRFQRDQGTFKVYLQSNQSDSLSFDKISSLCEDPREPGILWIGTLGGGLCRFDIAKAAFTTYSEAGTTANGGRKPPRIIYGILADDAGNLWISSTQGISKFDLSEKTFRNFTISDGLQGLEFTPGAYFKSSSGEMFFGGINGLNHFYPDDISDNPHIPPVVITDVKVFDQSLPPDAIQASAEGDFIELSYRDNFFAFQFAALDFTNSANNQYAYRLEGFDQDWIFCGSRRYASYTNLDPGEYLFKVIGSNNDEVWNEDGAALRIMIHPPFWRTGWFYLLLGGLIAAGLYFVHNVRIRQKVRAMEAVETVRKKAAADFHDELGHKLTKISLYSEVAKSSLEEDTSQLSEYLDEISDASGSLYQETRDFIWALDPENDSLFELALYLKDFGDELFHSSSVDFRAERIPKTMKNKNLSMETKQQLSRIFKEAMHNTLKHANAKNATLMIQLTGNTLKIEFSDDGKGFNQSENPQKTTGGQGLKNMSNRAGKIAGQLDILPTSGSGTRVTLVLNI